MKRILSFLLVLCLALGLTMSAQAAEPNTTPQDVQQVQKAIAEFNNNKTEQAISTISKLIKEQPNHLAAIFERGKMYLLTNQEDKATADFNTVITQEQDKALANYLVGEFYAQTAKFDQALEKLETAIRIDPKMAQPYFARALIKQVKKEGGAIQDLDKAIELDNKYVDAYLTRASLYLSENNSIAADKDLNKAISLVENKAQINYLVAQVYARAQNVDKVIVHATNSINAAPSAAAYAMRANAYSAQKQFDKSIADFDQAISLAPNAAGLYMERGVAYANNQDLNKAIADMNKAIELAPKMAMGYVNRGMMNLGLNKTAEAKADFKKAIALNPEVEKLVPAEYK